MFCKKCGTRLLNGVSVCHACGANIHEAELAKVYNPATGGNLNEKLTSNNNLEFTHKEKPVKEKNYGILVVLIVLIALLIIAVIKVLR